MDTSKTQTWLSHSHNENGFLLSIKLIPSPIAWPLKNCFCSLCYIMVFTLQIAPSLQPLVTPAQPWRFKFKHNLLKRPSGTSPINLIATCSQHARGTWEGAGGVCSSFHKVLSGNTPAIIPLPKPSALPGLHWGPNESGTDLEHPVSYDCKPMLHQLPNWPPCPQGILTAICLTPPRIGGCT